MNADIGAQMAAKNEPLYILVGECSAFSASGSDPTVLFTIFPGMIQ